MRVWWLLPQDGVDGLGGFLKWEFQNHFWNHHTQPSPGMSRPFLSAADSSSYQGIFPSSDIAKKYKLIDRYLAPSVHAWVLVSLLPQLTISRAAMQYWWGTCGLCGREQSKRRVPFLDHVEELGACIGCAICPEYQSSKRVFFLWAEPC